jgi:hypothetical protein
MSNQENAQHGGEVFHGESCVTCGDELTNDLERDTGVCDPCVEVSEW